MNTLLAVNWQFELRGILIVIIGTTVLMGSLYMILMTNIGVRLGFLVALAALAGWFFIMGAIWWSYGKGLLGTEASWQPVGGKTVLQDTRALSEAEVVDQPVPVAEDTSSADVALAVQSSLVASGWTPLDSAAPSFQQAGAAATVFIEESGALEAGEFQVTNVFDRGGGRHPTLWDGKIDFLGFFHDPHYSLVEMSTLVPQRDEPGRAPSAAVIDEAKPRQYVYMIRDLGEKRKPAGFITIGSLVVFLVLCYLMHTRDRTVAANRAAIPVKV